MSAMPRLIDRIMARLAYWHARRVYHRFCDALHDVQVVQQRTLRRVLVNVARSDYGRAHRLERVRTPDDLRRAAPLVTYDDLAGHIEQMCRGHSAALLSPGQQVHMFATSSGTTARRKLIPVTSEFIRQYRRGWNTFGLKMLSDHPEAILRPILQGSGRYDEYRTSAGIPCGAITGLLARSQKRIVRRYYVGPPALAEIPDPTAKYYVLMRLGVVADVAFAITANPATLIRMAQTADQHAETLIRDVHDGTIDPAILPDTALRAALGSHLRADPARAGELAELRRRSGHLRPADYWRLSFVACWTGGSLGHYLDRLRDWWGRLPVRDIGLLASEGRVTIPLEDDTPAGALDVQAALFEFIPLEHWHTPQPETLLAHELDVGGKYVVVLSNDAGLVRYRLDDVVRCVGHVGRAPLLEFLHRAGRVSSQAGEKLTENQLVGAVKEVQRELNLPEFDFLAVPRWADPPFYQVYHTAAEPADFARRLDAALRRQNEEYDSRRKSLRLDMLRTSAVDGELFARLDQLLIARRGSTAEQYKRPCLLTEHDESAALLEPLLATADRAD